MQRIILDVDACTLCGQCVQACPLSILVIQNNKISLRDPHKCFQCLQCMQICPEDCFSFPPVYEIDTDTQNKS
ncbi:Ferredoxin [Giardia duodenalis]|uniref:Ferredoxin n=1 Tax=Giardia intestinalis (strain ATCC 50803 / WB clone C6) TaxID=184922 RepID=D3KFY4_GIAIC|nr:Ferredoxin [Giardia intestinalis]KAE8302926.1 Ferredoxin [Giardia intestinalis]